MIDNFQQLPVNWITDQDLVGWLSDDKDPFMEPEFMDFLKVIHFGAAKHGDKNWLEPNGKKASHKEMHDSMFHHLAESFAGVREDKETGLDPLLHLISRAMMMYVRRKRGIKHEAD